MPSPIANALPIPIANALPIPIANALPIPIANALPKFGRGSHSHLSNVWEEGRALHALLPFSPTWERGPGGEGAFSPARSDARARQEIPPAPPNKPA